MNQTRARAAAKRALPIVAALVLSGCVTTTQLRSGTPVIETGSAKPSRAVAACITEKWQNAGIFGMGLRVDNQILEDGYSVSISTETGQIVQLLADVRDNGPGSTTKFYKPNFVLSTGRFEDAVRACQK